MSLTNLSEKMLRRMSTSLGWRGVKDNFIPLVDEYEPSKSEFNVLYSASSTSSSFGDGAFVLSYDRCLHAALIQLDFVEAMKILEVDKGLDYVDCYGRNLLHVALMSFAPLEIIQLLLDKGCDVKAKESKYGRTPLHFAVMFRASLPVLKILLTTASQANTCTGDKVRGQSSITHRKQLMLFIIVWSNPFII